MRKKYLDTVLQYSIDGTLLNEFETASEASTIVSYDSIIQCCKGKTKTAGGFIWKFKNTPIEHNQGNIECKICGSKETTRSMAMHLKWVHNMLTEQYVEQYGEFRQKKIKDKQLCENSGFECSICGLKVKSKSQLMYHLTKYHPEIDNKQYWEEHKNKLAHLVKPILKKERKEIDGILYKTCPSCGEEKPLTDYYNYKNNPDGKGVYCIQCEKLKTNIFYHSTKDIRQSYYQEYREENKEYFNQYSNQHYHNNKQYYKDYAYIKYHTNDLSRLRSIISARISAALKSYNRLKQDRTIEYLGIPMSEYKQYLESKFDDKMSWDNYGSYWEIDHIRPCASFDLSSENELYECFNYSNTQPLEKIANKIKSAKY